MLAVIEEMEDCLEGLRQELKENEKEPWTREKVDAELGRRLLDSAQLWHRVKDDAGPEPKAVEDIPEDQVMELQRDVAQEWVLELTGVIQ